MPGLTFHLIPHTHWDREWYLPQAGFLARLVPLLDDLIARLEIESDYSSFLLDGQTVLLEDYLSVRPDQRERVSALVRSGRLQTGPWYVLADELIPSGESLLRNLLIGSADARGLGRRMDVLYAPDSFGHPKAWPVLAREFGIEYGVIWRGYGGEPGQGEDRFWWRASDGREVLVYHLPPAGYEIGVALPRDWSQVRDTLVRRSAGRHIPIFIGADHHAPHQDIERLRARLGELDPASEFRVSRLEEFFAEAVQESRTLAVVQGELRWSYRYTWTLQGVHGTRAPLKRRNSALELLLERSAEPLAALANPSGGQGRRALLHSAWRQLIQCHFHDAIAGCSADSVARTVATRFDAVAGMTDELIRASLQALVGHDPDRAREARTETIPTLVLWNPAARRRSGIVIADATFFCRDILIGPPGGRRPGVGRDYQPFALFTAEGEMVPVQTLWQRRDLERLDALRHYPDQDEVERVRMAFRAPSSPGLGLRLLNLARPAPLPGGPFTVAERRRLRNRFVEVIIEPRGTLTVVNRQNGERFRHLLELVGVKDEGDTYSSAARGAERPLRIGGLRTRVLAGGPLFAAIETRWSATPGNRGPGRLGVRLVVMLDADSPTVRCILDLDNQVENHRLRARFPLGIPDSSVLAGTQLGIIRREPVIANRDEYPLETPATAAPAQRFVAAARNQRGLAVMATGFFEYEWTAAGDVLVTLLRSVGQLSKGDLWTRPGHAGWPMPTPEAQCLGETRVELALTPVTEEEVSRGTVPDLWEDAFLPVRGFWIRDYCPTSPPASSPVSGKEEPGLSIELEGEGLVVSAIKPAENGEGIILRCYNITDEVVAGLWRFGGALHRAARVRADETQPQAVALEDGGRMVRFEAPPQAVVTFRVEPAEVLARA